MSTVISFFFFTYMETNNYAESWHNQLNTTSLGRKRNGRVNRLVLILVKDFIHNINRIRAKVGRIGPEERRRRRKEMEAEAINAESMMSMTTVVNNGCVCTVSSFSTEGANYGIKRFRYSYSK